MHTYMWDSVGPERFMGKHVSTRNILTADVIHVMSALQI